MRTSSLLGQRVQTGTDGTFTLHDVPKDHVYLYVSGARVGARSFFDDGGAPMGDRGLERLDDIELVLARRTHLQVHLADPAEADRFRVLDAQGTELRLSERIGIKPSAAKRSSGDIVDGHSAVVSVPDHGVTLVLLRGEDEVRRVPLELAPDELNEVR